jgi:hypothetical protein
MTISLDAAGVATISASDIDNGSYDNCGIATLVLDKTTFGCADVNPNTLTLTVTDVNGNVNSATATVTVIDEIAPMAVCKPVTVTLAGGTASITPQMVDNVSSDACGIQSMVVSPDAFDCTDIGDNPVTLTVTDNHGNVSSCTTLVTVVGEIPSCSIAITMSNTVFTGGDGKTIFLGYGAETLTATANATSTGPFTYLWTGGNGYLSSVTLQARCSHPRQKESMCSNAR